MMEATDEHGRTIGFDCPETIASRWTSKAILEGRTYPALPFLPEVKVVVDAGANCGAASVHFARSYPAATVHAFEPGGEAGAYLDRNAAAFPSIQVHHFGLFDRDQELELHLDPTDLGQSSVLPPAPGAGPTRSELVQLRAAGPWAAEAGITAIDVLKVDVEGCEVEVLESLGSLATGAAAIHVEYDHRAARRAIEAMLGPTHELYFAMLMSLDQGECLYLRRDQAERPEASARLKEIFAVVTR
jgi:FkbM family methyltransferase